MAPSYRDGKASGRAVLKGVRERIAHGWPAGLTVLSGEDRYHLDAAQREILESLSPRDATDYGVTVFGDEEVELKRVVGAARARGMFASRRVVLVRDVLALRGDPEDLEGYASDPPAASHLLVRAVKLDRKRKIHQLLASASTFLEFQTGSPGEVAREAIEMGAERGVVLDLETAAFLVDLCALDLHRVKGELEKIRCWLGDGGNPRVDQAIVRTVAAATGIPDGWEVANAVLARSTGDALAAVRRLLDDGSEPIRIVGGLAWRARSMLQAKAMLQAGVSSRDVVTASRAWAFGDALLSGLKRYSLAELLAFPSRLLRSDRALKSGSLPARAVLESLVSDLTAAPKKKPAEVS